MKPKSNVPGRTACGNLSWVALLRPLPALMISSITFGSTPALTPMASASEVIATAVSDKRLLPSLTTWASPGFSPTKKTLPKVPTMGRATSNRSFGQATMTARVPFLAPLTPPETGASIHWMPRSARPAATRIAVPGPMVESSIRVLTRDPSAIPPAPSATCSTISGVGRLVSTISAAAATSAAERAPVAPRLLSRCIAASSTS